MVFCTHNARRGFTTAARVLKRNGRQKIAPLYQTSKTSANRDFSFSSSTPNSNIVHDRHAPTRPADLFRALPKRLQQNIDGAGLTEPQVAEQTTTNALQSIKLSSHGSENSLFLDCLDRIRDARRAIEFAAGRIGRKPSRVIDELGEKEKHIVHQLLKRVDPNREVAPNLAHGGDYIDPFWSPFRSVENVKNTIYKDFVASARLSSVAKALKERERLRRHYRVAYGLCDPLRNVEDRTRCRTDTPLNYPEFKRGIPDRYWDPSALRRQVLYNNNRPITWRDLHILQFFIAETGMVLPRRMTMATRRQQVHIYRAIKQAQAMGVFPRGWKPLDTEQMRMEDPLQFLTDVLTIKYIKFGSRRAKAMIRAISDRAPQIDTRKYIRHRIQLRMKYQRMKKQLHQEAKGDFSVVLNRYS